MEDSVEELVEDLVEVLVVYMAALEDLVEV